MRKNIGLGFIIFCLFFFSRSALVLVRFFIPHSFPCSVCVAGFVFKFQISRLSRSLNLTGSKKSPRTFFSSAISSFLFLALLRHSFFLRFFFFSTDCVTNLSSRHESFYLSVRLQGGTGDVGIRLGNDFRDSFLRFWRLLLTGVLGRLIGGVHFLAVDVVDRQR